MQQDLVSFTSRLLLVIGNKVCDMCRCGINRELVEGDWYHSVVDERDSVERGGISLVCDASEIYQMDCAELVSAANQQNS